MVPNGSDLFSVLLRLLENFHFVGSTRLGPIDFYNEIASISHCIRVIGVSLYCVRGPAPADNIRTAADQSRPEIYLLGEGVEDDSDPFSNCFAFANERKHAILMFPHRPKPGGFILREVSPFCAIEPLKDQEKQKKVWEIFNNVNGLRFDDALSIDPGDANGGACREALAYGRWPRNGSTYLSGGC